MIQESLEIQVFLVMEKNCEAQNWCNLSYLKRQKHEYQKNVQLKFLDLIQKRELSRFVQLEVVYLKALL